MSIACRLLVAGAVLALAGCGLSGGTAEDELVVFAASSLTEAFDELGERFEARHPGSTVTFSYGSSATLAAQLIEGAPADVYAAANPATMSRVTRAGLAPDDPPVFVRNRLQIAVPAGNPERLRGLVDLARDDLKVALCAPQVPCGTAAKVALRAAGVSVKPQTYEKDVKAALAKLTLGEVDAALVYRTDVIAAGERVDGIDFPEAGRAVNDYQIAVLGAAPHPTRAAWFVALVRSEAGRRVMSEAGFELP